MKKPLRILIVVFVAIIVLVYLRIANSKKTFETCTIHNISELSETNFKKHKTVLVSASTLYESDMFKTLLQGENYRDAWKAKVELPIVFLDTLFGGVEIIKEGGGKQTHSLRLKSKKDGIMYSMRSINKNPEKLVPEFAKTLGLENIIMDGISSQHPYASPVVARLSESINVPNTNPKAVFIPKQKTLENYNDKFGNRLFMIEYETKGDVNWTNYENVTKIVDTEDLQELKMELNDSLQIDKASLVRARLFDLVIGDWDRHTKQWGWAIVKNEFDYKAYPIPGDRDNAFFKTSGLIPSILTNENVIEELRPFENDIEYMEGLIYDFDIYFLHNTPETIFIEQANYIQTHLTDNDIENALRYWNDDLYNLHAKDIASKIKARRDNLLEYAKEFKRVLDTKPLLENPLKGSEREDVSAEKLKCFEC
ncbi:hypothetical protein IMCC3317_02940 [Kordia antarctica]|uniref:Uncharacterized protein n=1 Tax=Kordia antarctica TaxID=1218801 RepID=A0A7L4ZEJ1_9FLAO|nr:hypothetical protein [Kordia antarctica]QHI34949.1 hypothetical protein IMCC3317_02940 [Kordia antarctica]